MDKREKIYPEIYTNWHTYQVSQQVWEIIENITEGEKIRHSLFIYGSFHQFLVLFKNDCLVTLFDRKLQVSKNSPKLTILGIFNFVHSKGKKYRSQFNLTNFWAENFGMIFT